MKTVPHCTLGTAPHDTVTKADPKFAGVSSPFDVSSFNSFNSCNTCYYIAVTAITGTCESELLGGGGFSLLPCI